MTLPPDWRDTMTAWVRGAEEPDADWFGGGPWLSPREQIEVYRDQYRLRVYDALLVEVPGLAAWLGDAAEPLLRDYLRDHPSPTWTLNRVAHRLVPWLRARGEPAVVVEMAALDGAVMAGFEAASGSPLSAGDLAELPELALQPHVALLRATHSVHLWRSAVLSRREPPPMREGDFHLVVFRRGLKMRHVAVDPGAWTVLDAIRTGRGVSGAVERLVAGGADPAGLGDDLRRWFKDFGELQLLRVSNVAHPTRT